MLYVFVEIAIDNDHFVGCVKATLPPDTKLTVMGTIQVAAAIFHAKPPLEAHYADVEIPQAKPLSPGEVLGCTAPDVTAAGCEAFVFVADGRFHLEARLLGHCRERAVPDERRAQLVRRALRLDRRRRGVTVRRRLRAHRLLDGLSQLGRAPPPSPPPPPQPPQPVQE